MMSTEARLAEARELIVLSRDKHRARACGGGYDDGRVYANGAAAGLDRALEILEWKVPPRSRRVRDGLSWPVLALSRFVVSRFQSPD